MPNDDTTAHPLEFLFHPRGVAVAGASLGGSRSWGGGNMFTGALQKMGFPGGLYAVNPKATADSEIHGVRVYPALRDIPGPVDYVISSVPATAVLDLIGECEAKGVRAIHLFTAGFGETGIGDRSDLEREAVERARAAGIRLVGPNCMGVYCPESGLSFNPMFPKDAGSVGVVSQSGLNAQEIVTMGAARGLRFSRVVSFGNGADLNEADFFEYLAADPNTEAVGTYLEGVKDGPRTFRALKALGARKPVVLLKGGATEAGERAARSHTGSLAGSHRVWAALVRQAGLIGANSVEELCDSLVALRGLPQGLPGRRAVIITSGGGTSVLAADACARAGIDVPALAPDIERRLAEFTPVAGQSVRNPLDTFALTDRDVFLKTIDILNTADNIDFYLILARPAWGMGRPQEGDKTIATIAEARDAATKPMVVTVREPMNGEGAPAWFEMQQQCAEHGLAVFPTIERTAVALRRLADWQRDRAGNR